VTGTTYPLDLVRSRLSIATASMMAANNSAASSSQSSSMFPPPPSSAGASTSSQLRLASALHTSARPLPSELSIWGMTLKVMREEGGPRALYRGLVATAMGVAPYVGINFAAYETLRGLITPPGKNNVARKLTCGALAGKQYRGLYPGMLPELTLCGRNQNNRIGIADTYISV
jgi:solute carrier family 25 phosphate transporter 23/24/25/41